MAHWSDSYIGQPYIPGEADCLRLYCRVSSEVFKRTIPNGATVERAASALGRVQQMTEGTTVLATRVDKPVEGDAVLMMCRGRPSHIGAFCVVDGEASVLHAMANAGMTVRHCLRDLPRVGLTVEGLYQWK